jgi:quercetin dioxygenase-like cupin family protein
VRTLARQAGFSPSFVSQVELNQASPSIASLERLAAALEVTLGEVFREPGAEASPVTRAGRRRPLTSWWSRAQIEALTPMTAGHPFEAMLITMAAGGSSGKRLHTHPGFQLAVVFQGEVRLTLGDEARTLSRGDAVTLDPGTPHRWDNPRKTPARLVIVSSRVAP